jgi:hypothetical protein
MIVFSVVLPGRDQEILDAHKKAQVNWAGLLQANIIKTGGRIYCIDRRCTPWLS